MFSKSGGGIDYHETQHEGEMSTQEYSFVTSDPLISARIIVFIIIMHNSCSVCIYIYRYTHLHDHDKRLLFVNNLITENLSFQHFALILLFV